MNLIYEVVIKSNLIGDRKVGQHFKILNPPIPNASVCGCIVSYHKIEDVKAERMETTNTKVK